MTTYQPLPVLPAFTDEALRNPDGPYRNLADSLLTIPAGYRQAAFAEVTRRTTRTRYADTPHGRMAEVLMIDTGRDEHAAVIAEIRAQLGL